MELQELIKRGRFIFSSAPKRLEVYKVINGKKNAKEIALMVGKSHSAALKELQKIKDIGLIQFKKDTNGKEVKKNGSIVYEKTPLAKHIPITYFKDPIKSQKNMKANTAEVKKRSNINIKSTRIPSETEILDICNHGETQLYEFKSAGTETRKLTKEIAAMLHNKLGGIIFYGVEDDGIISGTDKTSQQIDQPLQNQLRRIVAPPPTVKILRRDLMGQKILLIVIPPWDRKTVYYYEGRICVRKGTNVFVATPEESRKLHKGNYII